MRGSGAPMYDLDPCEDYTVAMVRYAITDGTAHDANGKARLMERARRWADEGVEFVQLREQSLEAGELLALAEATVETLHARGRTKLLVNARADIAVAAGADGVHLTARAGELTPAQVRQVFAKARVAEPVVSVSCHSLAEVERAVECGADLLLFGPVFEKRVDGVVVVEGVGLEILRLACAAAGRVPVLALGGVTKENVATCRAAGADGLAAIRMFS
jgi:thiamine-phosphate pyrophosphorylase